MSLSPRGLHWPPLPTSTSTGHPIGVGSTTPVDRSWRHLVQAHAADRFQESSVVTAVCVPLLVPVVCYLPATRPHFRHAILAEPRAGRTYETCTGVGHDAHRDHDHVA